MVFRTCFGVQIESGKKDSGFALVGQPVKGLCVREERSTDIRPCKSPIRNLGHTQRSELSTGDSLGKREGVSAEEVDMSMSKR